MIEMMIAGFAQRLRLQHLVMDVEGTIAMDGRFLDEIFRPLTDLKDRLDIHMLTTDPFRSQQLIDRRLGLEAVILSASEEVEEKAAYVQALPPGTVAAIGQGAADAAMLEAAALGISVLSSAGLAKETVLAADMVVPSISDALALFVNPLRIVNTLSK